MYDQAPNIRARSYIREDGNIQLDVKTSILTNGSNVEMGLQRV